MYHFAANEQIIPPLELLNGSQWWEGVLQYLRDFQVSAVRFLYNHLARHAFCILNDESGLGKTTTLAAVLNMLISKNNKKKCLIVSTNDDYNQNWHFHLSVLTGFNVCILENEEDISKVSSSNIFRVFLVKWDKLRSIGGDLNKMAFDLVLLDNRGQMLNNHFCTSLLLRHFEGKVSLVVSSVDVTSDIKLLHNILRLGGHLDRSLENFKAFQEKFKLPDFKAISNKSADLEEYFRKREMLNDYCRPFRLRRYAYQYKNSLPLATPETYKNSLKKWTEDIARNGGRLPQLTESEISTAAPSSDVCTEELFQQFLVSRIEQQTPRSAEIPIHNSMNTAHWAVSGDDGGARVNLNSDEDVLDMPPLLLVSDSDDDERGCVKNKPNPKKPLPPGVADVVQVNPSCNETDCDDDVQMIGDSATSSMKKKQVKRKKRTEVDFLKENVEMKSSRLKRGGRGSQKVRGPPQKEKTKKEKKTKREGGKQIDLEDKARVGVNKLRSEEKKSSPNRSNEKATTTTAPRALRGQKQLSTSKVLTPSTTNTATAEAKRKSSSRDSVKSKELNIGQSMNRDRSEGIPQIKTRVQSPKSSDAVSKDAIESKTRKSPRISGEYKADNINVPKGKDPKSSPTISCTNGSAIADATSLTPRTRVSERKTRSGGGDDLPVASLDTPASKVPNHQKRKATSDALRDRRNASATQSIPGSVESNLKVNAKEPKAAGSPSPAGPSSRQKEGPGTKTVEPNDKNKSMRQPSASSQVPVFPLSDIEELQCAQKLSFDSSTDTSLRNVDKLINPFLVPSTPPSLMRMSQYPGLPRALANLPSSSPLTVDSDSDCSFVPPAALESSKRNGLLPASEIIVVSSSQDDASSISSDNQQNVDSVNRQSAQRKRFSKRKRVGAYDLIPLKPKLPSSSPVPARPTARKPLTQSKGVFGSLLDKTRTKDNKSPDVFSTSSEISGSGGVGHAFAPQRVQLGKGMDFNITSSVPVVAKAFDGFKIFGSEVQMTPESKKTNADPTSSLKAPDSIRRSNNKSSCLEILEQIFRSSDEKKQQDPHNRSNEAENSRRKSRRKVSTPLQNEIHNKASTQSPSPRKATGSGLPQHSKQTRARTLRNSESNGLMNDESIFEITNNTTFGNTLHISANGHVSPVQAQTLTSGNCSNPAEASGAATLQPQQQQQQHNKITNYLVNGHNNTDRFKDTDIAAALSATPKHQRGQASSKSSQNNHNKAARSPKASGTQTTKLTKWFRRSSGEDILSSVGLRASDACKSLNRSPTIRNQRGKSALDRAIRSETKRSGQKPVVELRSQREEATAKRRRLDFSLRK